MTATQVTEQQSQNASVLAEHADVVQRYFTLFNLGDYCRVAQLFAPDGALYPPFESPVVGPDSIRDYLVKEAVGMTISLLSAETHAEDPSLVEVRGRVTALVFQVNVTWGFVLTRDNTIQSVRVDLVATLEELLKLKPEKAT